MIVVPLTGNLLGATAVIGLFNRLTVRVAKRAQ